MYVVGDFTGTDGPATASRTTSTAGSGPTPRSPSVCQASGTLLLGGKKVGSGRAQGAGTVSVTLKLDRKGKRRIKRLRRATLTVRVTATPGGSASQTLTLER